MSPVQDALGTGSSALEQACRDLYTQHQGRLVLYARLRGCDSHEAWDLVQDVFLRLFRLNLLLSLASHSIAAQTHLLNRSLRWLMQHRWRRQMTLRRGAGRRPSSLNLLMEEGWEQADSRTPEDDVDRAWALAVMNRSLQRLSAPLDSEQWTDIEAGLFKSEAAGRRSTEPGFRVCLHRQRRKLRHFVSEEAGFQKDHAGACSALLNAINGGWKSAEATTKTW